MSRPSEYSTEKADYICGQLADGKSLRTICRQEDMPSMPTVFKWLRERPEFLAQYARAREDQADAFAEEISEIADDGTNDWMETHGKDGSTGWVLNGEHIQRSRLRVDARKWIASKLKPKKYGDKVELSGDKDAPLELRLGVIKLTRPKEGE